MSATPQHFSNPEPQHQDGHKRRRIVAGVGLAALVAIVVALALGLLDAPLFGRDAGGGMGGQATQEADGSDSSESTSDGAQAGSSDDAQAEPVDITIVAVGDVLQHQGVWLSGQQADGTYNFDHIYAHLGDALSGSDLNVLNQESILGGSIAPFSSYPSFNGPQEMGDAEVKAGFNVILRASNHTMDMGYDGLASELSFWATQHPEVAVLGAADPDLASSAEAGDTDGDGTGTGAAGPGGTEASSNSDSAGTDDTTADADANSPTQSISASSTGSSEVADSSDTTVATYSRGVPSSVDDVYVFEKDGFRVALLNYTYDLNGYSDPRGLVSMLDEDHVRQTLATAREQADMVVVFPHWGEEYQTAPVASQEQWEEFFLQNGADVIIGGHPHVIEPVETFERAGGGTGVCFWSLGNFVSGQAKNETLVGGMARVTLHKDADGSCSVTLATLEPLITHKGLGDAMTVYRLRDYTNELAGTNAFYGVSNTSLTPAWAQDFCSSVLGSNYDPATSMLQISVGAS